MLIISLYVSFVVTFLILILSTLLIFSLTPSIEIVGRILQIGFMSFFLVPLLTSYYAILNYHRSRNVKEIYGIILGISGLVLVVVSIFAAVYDMPDAMVYLFFTPLGVLIGLPSLVKIFQKL